MLQLTEFQENMKLLKEVNELANNINVKNRNSNSNLDPCLVQEGIIRVAGRIDISDINDECTHPVIPKESQISI